MLHGLVLADHKLSTGLALCTTHVGLTARHICPMYTDGDGSSSSKLCGLGTHITAELLRVTGTSMVRLLQLATSKPLGMVICWSVPNSMLSTLSKDDSLMMSPALGTGEGARICARAAKLFAVRAPPACAAYMRGAAA